MCKYIDFVLRFSHLKRVKFFGDSYIIIWYMIFSTPKPNCFNETNSRFEFHPYLPGTFMPTLPIDKGRENRAAAYCLTVIVSCYFSNPLGIPFEGFLKGIALHLSCLSNRKLSQYQIVAVIRTCRLAGTRNIKCSVL